MIRMITLNQITIMEIPNKNKFNPIYAGTITLFSSVLHL